MEALMPLIMQLISGAVGGNIIGALAKKLSLGFLGNTVAGLVGGGLGGSFLAIPLVACSVVEWQAA